MDAEFVLQSSGILKELEVYLHQRKPVPSVDGVIRIPACNYFDLRAYFQIQGSHSVSLGDEAAHRRCIIEIHPDGQIDLRAFVEDFNREYVSFSEAFHEMLPENDDHDAR